MALEIKCSIVESTDALGFVIKDTTGVYASPGNPTGWGGAGGNDDTGDITAVNIKITTPDGTIYTHSVSLVDWLADFFSANLYEYEILASAITGEDEWIDGYYQIEYECFVSATEYTYTTYQGFRALVWLRSTKVVPALDIENATDAEYIDANMLEQLMSGAKTNAELGKGEEFQTIIDVVTEILEKYE